MTSAAQPDVNKYSKSHHDYEHIGTRRFIWLLCFGLSSLGLTVLDPGLYKLAILAAGLSMGCWIWGGGTEHLDCNDNIFGTVLGGILSAVLLAMAILAGNYLANLLVFEMQNLVSAFATIFGLLLFATFTVTEMLVSSGLQLLVSHGSAREARLAYQLDMRFGGFLGEIST